MQALEALPVNPPTDVGWLRFQAALIQSATRSPERQRVRFHFISIFFLSHLLAYSARTVLWSLPRFVY